MGYRPTHINAIIANALESQAYMLHKTSYVAEDYRNSDVLYYLQTYFDLAGLYSLEYRNRMMRNDRAKNPSDAEILSRAANSISAPAP